jgi:hypothetical protein
VENLVSSFFKERGVGVYALFETFVIRLLQGICDSEHKKFDPMSKNRYFDCYLAEGVNDIPGPAVVEIKLVDAFSVLQATLKNLILSARLQGCKSILLIVGGKVSHSSQVKLKKLSENLEVEIFIWDFSELDKKVHQYPQAASWLLPQLLSVSVKSIVESPDLSTDENIEERRKHLEEIRQSFNLNRLTLCLGAGVSIGAGIPSWNKLLSRLVVEVLRVQSSKEIGITQANSLELGNSLLIAMSSSPLSDARYISAALGGEFEKTTSRILYESVTEKSLQDSKTLKNLGLLCSPERGGAGVRSVITYNFDDLFERSLGLAKVRYQSIYRENQVIESNQLPIYHVHGFLPESTESFDGIKDSLLVFSEERYHRMYSDVYSWSNMIQLNHFKEMTCVFVGVSLTDPNMRRLLDIAYQKTQTARHFVILKRSKLESPGDVSRATLAYVEAMHHRLYSQTLADLGVRIIWVDEFEEIPNLLDSMRPS